MSDPVWILASNSPRRKELLALFKQPFQVQPANIDESVSDIEAPDEYVRRMANSKAMALHKSASTGAMILAADTTVALNDEILGKPADAAEARKMLQSLKGRKHQVYTALALVTSKGDLIEETCRSEVPMRNYSAAEIESYIASGDPFDKAGGYAIQHAGFHPVVDFQGCFANVMGLPLCHLARSYTARSFTKSGCQPAFQINQACQAFLRYDCPISERVLAGETIG